ncbi:MAG: NAD-dependent epimerase/dehydratase family protein [Acidimicrobiales bacterium]
MRVLVTGATSLLGRHTVARLLDAGHDVVVLQRTPCGLDGVVEHLGSVTDGDVVDTAMAGVDGVIHLAAKVDPVGDWADFEAINVEGTATVHAAARAAGVSRFVYVSSPSVAHDGSSISGDGAAPADPERAHGHYSVSKAMAERALLAASDDTMPVVAVRPHLVIGPGDTQLVGRIVDRARTGRMPLIGSGLALVDTTWVDNAAASLLAALDALPGVGGRAFVVSNGEPRTVHELIARITAAAGVDWSPRTVPARAAIAGGAAAEAVWERSGRDGEPPMTAFGAEQLSTAHWFDQRETRTALGWAPEVSLADGWVRLAASFAKG